MGSFAQLGSLCVLAGDGSFFERPRDSDELIGMRGDGNFVVRHDAGGSAIVELDAATGSVRRTIHFAPPSTAQNLVSGSFRLSHDGMISGTVVGYAALTFGVSEAWARLPREHLPIGRAAAPVHAGAVGGALGSLDPERGRLVSVLSRSHPIMPRAAVTHATYSRPLAV
jgi:hypothetical protein